MCVMALLFYFGADYDVAARRLTPLALSGAVQRPFGLAPHQRPARLHGRAADRLARGRRHPAL